MKGVEPKASYGLVSVCMSLSGHDTGVHIVAAHTSPMAGSSMKRQVFRRAAAREFLMGL